jgi:subtilisin family serine protease
MSRAIFLMLVILLQACTAPPPAPDTPGSPAAFAERAEQMIIVAVDDPPEGLPRPGSTPRARYSGLAGYAGGSAGAAASAALADENGLQEQAFWSIAPLQWRCMLYRLAPGADKDAVMSRLARDSRVRLVQNLNEFETLATVAEPTSRAARPEASADGYDDPYLDLQRGFAAIQALQAQRWSRGEGVRIALVDTGVDARHPDLLGRVAEQRDMVGGSNRATPGGESHGTQMAGVIAATANNRIGIVGVAPDARLLLYRACWPVAAGASRCNSYTLAQALAAAIEAGADIINLSLGGPADPLLQRLVEQALRNGTIVVGAVPPGGVMTGFPVGVAGVLAVASSDDAAPVADVLAAPGRDILTLAPGGQYGYASGSSLAAAHVSGAVAVLRSLQPGLRAGLAQAWLKPAVGHSPIDLCRAIQRLKPRADCRPSAVAARAASGTP